MSDAKTPAPVYLVEDDPVARLLLEDAVSREGYRTLAFERGEDALDAVGAEDPLVILLDLQLPGIDGFEVCKRLRASHRHRHVPVLLMTGLDDVASVQAGFGAGATDFITKPINVPLLLERLQFILRASESAERLRKSQERLEKAQRLARISYWEADLEKRVVEVSPDIQRGFGLSTSTVPIDALSSGALGGDVSQLIEKARLALQTGEPFVLEQTTQFGGSEEKRVILHQAELIEDEDGRRLLGTSQDITERRNNERTIETLANFDALTGLPNRRLLHRHLESRLAAVELGDVDQLAVLALDLDLFKRVNDSMGYEAGDKLLVAVSQRLQKEVRHRPGERLQSGRDHDLVARVSGDEFVIVFHGIKDRDGARVAAERTLNCFERPFRVGTNQNVFVSASAGVLLAPDDAASADALFKGLDVALQTAKRRGRNNWQFFESLTPDAMTLPVALSSELRRALKGDELYLVYQPKFDQDRKLIGLEALSRWTHDKLGPISPATFIPIAEESGQVMALGDWVIEEACRQIRSWLDSGFDCPPIAINIAARQCVADDLLEKIQHSLDQQRIPSHLLEVELTESALIESRQRAVDQLSTLRHAGIKVSLDDFGTGYSSLSYLKGLPIDEIKIDRSFIEDITRNEDSAKIVEAIIGLSHTLGLSVVAEGVEHLGQFDLLCDIHCDRFQGFALAKPLPPSDVENLFEIKTHEVSGSR